MTTTKFSNNKQQPSANDNLRIDNNHQYSNLNLNQGKKCSVFNSVKSCNKPFSIKNNGTVVGVLKDIKKFLWWIAAPLKLPDSTLSDKYGKQRKLKAWNKSSDLCLNTLKLNDKHKEAEKQWKNKDSLRKNNSTLSLHIAAYENLNEATITLNPFDGKNKSSLKREEFGTLRDEKQIFSSEFVIQNQFEFPRQQNGNVREPEVSQFRASQRLLNSNGASASETTNMASGSSSSNAQQRNSADSLILDELKNTIDMNCSVCFEVFTEPLLLKCGHTFCKKCTDSLIRCARENAQQQYQYGTPTISCPECRAEMPADGRFLVKNFRLADIINQFNLLQTDSNDVSARGVNTSPATRAVEILCNSCNEMNDPKHIFCCSWCSNGRQEPFFACGTCCVTKHPQHQLTPYKQMATPEEREIFVNNVMSVLRDASSSLQADFGESIRITPEYQNLKNKIRDSFIHWDPVLNNLRTNPKLTKQAIEEHDNIIDNFLHLCQDTISQVKKIEKKHAHDLIALRETFSNRVADAFNTFSQSSNGPMISVPSTSVAAPAGNEFAYPGPNRHQPRPRRVLAFARRRMNNPGLTTMRATTLFPMDHSNNTNAAGRSTFEPLQPQRPPDSDDDL